MPRFLRRPAEPLLRAVVFPVCSECSAPDPGEEVVGQSLQGAVPSQALFFF